MSPDVWIGALLGLPVGILGGVYSGLVVARIFKFEELRTQVKHIVNGIQYMDQGFIKIVHSSDHANLINITSDLYYLRHRKAGACTNKIFAEVNEAIGNQANISIQIMEERNSKWQQMCREMKPNMLVILNPKPWM